MRNELELMEQIEKYLLGKMNDADKNAFEKQIQSDARLKSEVEKQRLLTDAVKSHALKQSIKTAGKKYFLKKNLFKWGLGGAGLLVTTLAVLFISGYNPFASTLINKDKEQFIKPPFQGINIPFTEYTINPAIASEISCPSGTIIHIPENPFVDENGKPVNRPIKLKYREFRNPAEIFIAGIPMNYDSAGKHFDFESAGMFEILAFDGDKPVFINPDKPIKVELASLSNENKFNQYLLDTINKEWKFVSKDNPNIIFTNDSLPKNSPIVPVISNPEKFRINIEADANQFPELTVYKGIKFEVSDENKQFDPQWSNKTWEKAILKRLDKAKYIVTFERGEEKHDVIAYPVLDSNDYSRAVKEFQIKTEQYDALLKEKENKNTLTEKNKENQLMQMDSSRISSDKKVAEEEAKRERLLAERQATEQTVFRVFMVNKFGIWNSDCPSSMPQGAKLMAKFSDDNNNSLKFECVYLVEKGRNAIFTYNQNYFPSFSFNPESKNMLWAITSDSKLAICSEEEFGQANKNTKSHVFKMHVLNQRPGSEKEIKQILGFEI